MEKYTKSSGIFLFVFILSIFNTIFAQEYDDMYFTKADRKQTDFNLKANRGDAKRAISAFENDHLEEVYLDKNINPEYIAKYQVQTDKKSSRRNQEVDYYPETTSNNFSSTSGYFNNYGRQVTPYQTASFKINFVNTYGFSHCPRETCYCYELIRRPEKTKITKELIKNAYKCKDEYQQMQDLVDMLNKR